MPEHWTLNKNLAWQLEQGIKSLRRVTSPVLKHIFWRHLGKDATAYVAKHQQWWEMCACVCNSIWTRMNKLVRHLEDSFKHLCEQWPNILFDNALDWSGWMRTLVHGPQGSDMWHSCSLCRHLSRGNVQLMTAIYFSHREIATQHHARFTPSQLALTEATDLAEIPLSVRHRDITGMYGWRLLLDAPHQPLDILNGASMHHCASSWGKPTQRKHWWSWHIIWSRSKQNSETLFWRWWWTCSFGTSR